MKLSNLSVELNIHTSTFAFVKKFLSKHGPLILGLLLGVISIYCFIFFYQNGLALSYNDARSHLDIGRRVVEGLKPGLAQIGSVWLPLPHILMIPTIWNDFMWHSGLAGSLQSMISFVATGLVIYMYLRALGVGILGRLVGVAIFILNLNVLYMQSTAMTELLLLGTMAAGTYFLLLWHRDDNVIDLIKSAFWIMMASLIRYDGWFLFVVAVMLIIAKSLRRKSYQATEGKVILFSTLAAFGIFLWFVWNWAIFKDPFYFAFGPFSAHSQQKQLADAGVLVTKGNLLFSTKIYLYSLLYNSGAFTAILGLCGAIALWTDKNLKWNIRLGTLALIAPFFFNILALYLGHSVLFIQGLSGNSWFNVRYGLMLLPSIAIFIGYLTHRLKSLRWSIVGLMAFVTFFSFTSADAVTIDDGRVGASQKNVVQVSTWLHDHAKDQKGFVMISAASHDAIIFSSGLPMKKFIHEGTGLYWDNAIATPQKWARWIIMRTNDVNDLTFKEIKDKEILRYYTLVGQYEFADIYELKPEYADGLTTEPVFSNQK